MTKALWASCRRLNSLARAAARRHNSSYQGIHKVERVEVPTNALEGLNTSVWKPVLFSVLVAGGGCLWMAEKTNYDTSCRKEKLSSSSRGRSMSVAALAWGNTWPSSDDLNRSRQDDVRQRLQGVLNWSKNKYRELTRATIIMGEGWLNTPEDKRTCYALVAGQVVVFLAWQSRRLQPFMMRNFLSHPLSNRVYTNFTSIFSHNSALHIGFNSIAFLSIGTSAHLYFWNLARQDDIKTSTARYEFLAFFVAGGLMASMSSQIWTLAVRVPRLLRTNAAPTVDAINRSILPSLGASGAIWSCLSVTALAFPDAEVCLIILPFFAFPIGYGVAAMALVDVAGLLFRWRLFDHAAHLGGAAFGALYYYCGHDLFVYLRKMLGGNKSLKRVA